MLINDSVECFTPVKHQLIPGNIGTDVHSSGDAVTLHSAGDLYGLSHHSVARQLISDHTRHHWTRVNSNSYLEGYNI